MRDRLIGLIKHDNCRNPYSCSNKCQYVSLDDCHSARIADYLLANGVIVPPCKIGDKVYCIVKECVSDDDYRMSWHNETNILERKFTLSMIELFGKTVFLTKEEAEQALKDGGEK